MPIFRLQLSQKIKKQQMGFVDLWVKKSIKKLRFFGGAEFYQAILKKTPGACPVLRLFYNPVLAHKLYPPVAYFNGFRRIVASPISGGFFAIYQRSLNPGSRQ